MVYKERRDKSPLTFYVHCGAARCKQWYRIEFDELGRFLVVPLKKYNPKTNKDYHIDMNNVPVPVKCEQT